MTYIVQYATSRNSKCREHSKVQVASPNSFLLLTSISPGGYIPKGELRIRQNFQSISGNSQQWTCWGCITPTTLAEIRTQIEN
ncbi:hypothetical protein L218DRAFT_991909, partial [Marasmius fiardii PR-910]